MNKIEGDKELSSNDKKLLSKIKELNPDCLAYESHAKDRAINFMFFEKGFYKLSIRDVRLRLGDRPAKNHAIIGCASGSDYSPSPKSYGKYFESVAKVRMNKKYLLSDEYISREAIYRESINELIAISD